MPGKPRVMSALRRKRANPKPKPPTIPEKTIERAILSYLGFKRIFAWKVKTVGTYDPTKRKFRKSGADYMKGVSDILGIYNGRMLAIEVKSARGQLRPEQKQFLYNVRANGGIAFVARSVEDVQASLAHYQVLESEGGVNGTEENGLRET